MPNGIIAHEPSGKFNMAELRKRARGRWPGLVGMDLAKDVTTSQSYTWDATRWDVEPGLRPT